MSFFSSIQGFNLSEIKKTENKSDDNFDYSEVDFCSNNEETNLIDYKEQNSEFSFDEYEDFENIDFEG